MTPSPRIFLARLFHETNTFVAEPTRLTDFGRAVGPELLKAKGDGSPLGSFLDFAHERGWDVLPGVDFTAAPSGPVEDEVVERFWELLSGEMRQLASPPDAFFFILHGAMTAQRIQDVEGELLQRVRKVPGWESLPIFGVLDLHANLTAAMTTQADCLVAYRENPHIDAAETSVRSAELLERHLQNGRPPLRQFYHLSPILWPAPGTGTADLPMRRLESMAREAEAGSETVWCVNIIAGFAHADIHDAGVAFSVVGQNESEAKAILQKLAEAAWDMRESGLPREWTIEDALEDASRQGQFPACLVESADNIGGGAPGDCTPLLRALLGRPEPSIVIMADALAVAAADAVEIGQTVKLQVGGRGFKGDAGPVKIEGTLINRTDGHFELEDHQSHLASMRGIHIEMGRSIVISCGPLTLLINSSKTPPFDLGQLRSQGIDPTAARFIAVKAAVAYRRAYEKIAPAHYFVATPGPCASLLTSLNYQHVRRPVFPLDPNASPS